MIKRYSLNLKIDQTMTLNLKVDERKKKKKKKEKKATSRVLLRKLKTRQETLEEPIAKYLIGTLKNTNFIAKSFRVNKSLVGIKAKLHIFKSWFSVWYRFFD